MALRGKVSRVGELKYTPAGVALCEFTVAVPQCHFEKDSMGYFEAQLSGQFAEDHSRKLRVGQKLVLRGSLWARTFRNRHGVKMSETKILVDSIEGETK